jgi:GNAT superfamily N-acetyltransferase
MTITFRELRADEEIQRAFPLMALLREHLREETFLADVRQQQLQGYELLGAYDSGRLVALAGVRRTRTLSRGEHLFVDDLVTEPDVQRRGYGRQLMAWLARRCQAEGITRIDLDARITARGFYEKLGFTFHTSVPCWIDTTTLATGDQPAEER